MSVQQHWNYCKCLPNKLPMLGAEEVKSEVRVGMIRAGEAEAVCIEVRF